MTAPLIDYDDRIAGCGASVTGGAVYRSCQVPAWDGVYFYGDYCSGNMWALTWDGRTVTDLGLAVDVGERILGTGWNAWGDVFVTTVDASPVGLGPGRIYRLAPAR